MPIIETITVRRNGKLVVINASDFNMDTDVTGTTSRPQVDQPKTSATSDTVPAFGTPVKRGRGRPRKDAQ